MWHTKEDVLFVDRRCESGHTLTQGQQRDVRAARRRVETERRPHQLTTQHQTWNAILRVVYSTGKRMRESDNPK